MNEPTAEHATDEQVDEMFGDLSDSEPDPSGTDVAVPEHTPADQEVVEDKPEQDEVTTDVPEVSEEVDTSTETEATQEDTTQAEETTETTIATEVEIKPEWQDMEKEALIELLAETEQKRRGFQSDSVKAADSLKTLQHIESTTGMEVNQMLSLFTDLSKPAFQQYLQSWYNGTPEDLVAQATQSADKSPQDFMPEGKEYDKDDALDPASESGRAYLNYNRHYNQQQQAIETNRDNQQIIQASQRDAKQWLLGQGQDIAEFDTFAAKLSSPLEIAKLIHAEMVRSKNVTANKGRKADDVLNKVRTNKNKVGSVTSVAGGETPQATEVSPVRKELNDVFGDY